jgi:hypothetical protein
MPSNTGAYLLEPQDSPKVFDPDKLAWDVFHGLVGDVEYEYIPREEPS